jgi:hypothetical protein
MDCLVWLGVQEAEVIPDVVVSGHGEGEEEDVVLFLIRRTQKVTRRSTKVHPGKLHTPIVEFRPKLKAKGRVLTKGRQFGSNFRAKRETF